MQPMLHFGAFGWKVTALSLRGLFGSVVDLGLRIWLSIWCQALIILR